MDRDKKGSWCKGLGPYHTLIPNAANAWDLTVERCKTSEAQRILVR